MTDTALVACKIEKITDCSTKNKEHIDKGTSELISARKPETAVCPSNICKWRIINGENLVLRYGLLYSRLEASNLLHRCEKELVYNTGILAKVKMFGKLIDIPRKQVAHGDASLSYTFSGNTVPAMPWTPLLTEIRDQVSKTSGYDFNFVLINRYKDGHDYMGEHKDDEKDLCQGHPIASLSLGQHRDFVFKHQDSRGGHKRRLDEKQGRGRNLEPVSILLEHGSLLLMEHPTNSFWYHSLPRRTRALGVRLNMTFRKMNPANCKPVGTSK
ncbi:scf e3 ubiquitin ligase complex f-box protein grra [Plakobranchus ocellatus]|uniref:DNA oxidative demethylase ALKBH2 n=1 Tax=Plakobranchus ocellatus TaxID=259542 RepID=A0AAV4DRK3_9GAST|nr:scf e3 ubiquitin ligase complex f-box protein grra [Plakobranchus ocellatus]